MGPTRSRALVLGLGCPLMGDDGLGIEVLGVFRERYRVPEGVDLLDGGTRGLLLLESVEGYDSLLVTDCVERGLDPPGRVERLEPAVVGGSFSRTLSPHQAGLNDLLAALGLLGRMPPRLAIIGMEPAQVAMGLGLSPAVRAALPLMADTVAAELSRWGFTPSRRDAPGARCRTAP